MKKEYLITLASRIGEQIAYTIVNSIFMILSIIIFQRLFWIPIFIIIMNSLCTIDTELEDIKNKKE